MKVNQITYGQSIRFMKISASSGQTIYGKNLAKAFEKRYGFLEGPKVVSDFDMAKGVTFLHGFFGGKTVIDKAMIYSNGMLADSKENTDECDAFIDDAVSWASQSANIVFEPDNTRPKIFLSHLTVETEMDFEGLFSKLNFVGNELGKFIEVYGDNRKFLPTGFSFQPDVSEVAGPVQFKFERRLGQPFSSNLYFSSAPLRTADHIQLLELLEKTIKS